MYEYRLTIAAGTTIQAPATQLMALDLGMVQKVEIEFPDGCVGLARARIKYHGSQLWPRNAGGYFASNDHVVEFRPMFSLTQSPVEMTLEGWNTDVYPHTLTVRLDIVPFSVAQIGQGFKTLSVEVSQFIRDLGARV